MVETIRPPTGLRSAILFLCSEKLAISKIDTLLEFAEQERKKIKQRQAEGIALAKANGKKLGRPEINYTNLTKEQKYLIEKNYDRWKIGDIKGVDFMELLGLKKNTFYKVIKEYEIAFKLN